MLIAVWTLRVSRHDNHQSSQQESTGLVTVSLADSTEIVQESARGMTQVKGARKCQRHPPRPHSKMTGSRPGTSIDQKHVLGVTTQFSQVH